MTMRSSGKSHEIARRLFDVAGQFLESAGKLTELGEQCPSRYSLCFYAADRTLLACLCGQGVHLTDDEYERRQTAELWERCIELNPRLAELEPEFRLLLDCEWAGLPGEKTPDLRQALDGAARLRSLVAELTPCLSPPAPEPERGMEMTI